MSGFFKGFFGEKKDEQEQAEAAMMEAGADPSDDEMEQLQADVQGTIDTKIEPEMLTDAESNADDDGQESAATADEGVEAGEEEPLKTAPEPAAEPGSFSAQAVWQVAGVSADDQATVKRAQTLLEGLPNSTPDAVKRQIVEASLKAFDISISDIVTGASSEIAALRNYIAETTDKSQRFTGESEARIQELEAEIASIRETMKTSEDERDRLVGAATEVIESVQPVLDFFGPGKTPKKSLGSNLPAPATPVVAADD